MKNYEALKDDPKRTGESRLTEYQISRKAHLNDSACGRNNPARGHGGEYAVAALRHQYEVNMRLTMLRESL